MTTYKEGDLFANIPDEGEIFIPHVVNNLGAFGAGFVVPLTRHFPSARQHYLEWVGKSDFKLGESLVSHFGKTEKRNVYVYHMLAQDGFPSQERRIALDYEALDKCMSSLGEILSLIAADGKSPTIIAPLFGAGIAGGDFKKIEPLIDKYWGIVPVSVFYLRDSLPRGWTPPS